MKAFYTLAAVALLLSYAGTRMANSNSTPVKAAATAYANQAQTYTGTIALLNGSLYVLRDERNDTWYHLDDQQMPAKFLGKKVVVTGKLDAGVNMICVKDIEPANG